MMQIASKVELHVGTQHGEATSWKRLGSFSFDSNERSKLQSRELKSVTVSVQALFLRIVLARCHMNSQNIYKQARVSAISCSASAVWRAGVVGKTCIAPAHVDNPRESAVASVVWAWHTIMRLCRRPFWG